MDTETARRVLNSNVSYDNTREEFKLFIKKLKPLLSCFVVFTHEKHSDFYRGLTKKIITNEHFDRELNPENNQYIQQIIKKQTNMTKGFQIANNLKILENIYNKAVKNKKFKTNKEITDLNDSISNILQELNNSDISEEEKKLRLEYVDKLSAKELWIRYKKFVENHNKQLKILQLDGDEKLAVNFQNIDPFLVIIFDEWFNFGAFKDIIELGANINITCIFFKCKNLPTNIYEKCTKLP